MHTQRQLLRLSAANFLSPSLSSFTTTHFLTFPYTPTNNNNNNNNHSSLCSAHMSTTWLAQLSEQLTIATAAPADVGPIELTSSIKSIVAASGDSEALQTATGVLLTGGFTLFLFRSLRRRAKLAKKMRFRSSGASKSLKDEAMENLKTTSKSLGRAKSPPSPENALLGALIAAAFGVLLFKFTTTVEYSLNSQTLSGNYSVRQITITIRTIINGLCYLATFVFGFNSIGLFLYSGQLALNSFVEVPSDDGDPPLNSSYKNLSDMDISGKTSADEDQNSNKNTK